MITTKDCGRVAGMVHEIAVNRLADHGDTSPIPGYKLQSIIVTIEVEDEAVEMTSTHKAKANERI